MTAAVPLRSGQVNGAGDADALFLKTFGGEVLAAFDEANKTVDKHVIRTISSGKSAAFPATWKVGGGYHTPGTEILGQVSNVNERVITIDDLLLSAVFIPNIDEAKTHYEYRSEYARQCGLFLANQWDKNVLQVGVLAARAAATVTGAYGGSSLIGANFKTSATDLYNGFLSAAQTLDEKDIPESEVRYGFIRPAQYYLLVQNKDLIDTDYSAGNGDMAKAVVKMAAGVELVKTMHLPVTNIAASPSTGVDANYSGNFSTTAALIMTKNAVGTVKLLDLAQEMDYDIRRQGTLVVAKYAVGHGILRPECAVELKTA